MRYRNRRLFTYHVPRTSRRFPIALTGYVVARSASPRMTVPAIASVYRAV